MWNCQLHLLIIFNIEHLNGKSHNCKVHLQVKESTLESIKEKLLEKKREIDKQKLKEKELRKKRI